MNYKKYLSGVLVLSTIAAARTLTAPVFKWCSGSSDGT